MREAHQKANGKARAESTQLAVERATAGAVEHLESVPVVETFRGETVWDGMVEVFSVANPPPHRPYGWAVEAMTETEYVAILGNPPVDSPIAAVRAWLIFGEQKMNARIVEYKVVHGYTKPPIGAEKALAIAVNQAISEGWEPLGGVAVDEAHNTCFYQALVKRENNPISN
jgi:Domain of unknown function (DUF1737)